MKKHFVLLLCCFTISFSINRPVYKVLLSQDGFVQFVNYELTVPALKEFTVCVWVWPEDLAEEQTIFSYAPKSNNNKLVRIWIEAGGTNIKVNLAGKLISTVPVGLREKDWRHICFSYQSDFGTWAFYLDGRLLTCEATLSLLGEVIPGGGIMRFGFGTNDEGDSCGFSGEIYGINMLLSSTIERKPKFKENKQEHSSDERMGKNWLTRSSLVQLAKEERNKQTLENYLNIFDAKRNLATTFDSDESKKPVETMTFPFYVASSNRHRVKSNALNQISNEWERPKKIRPPKVPELGSENDSGMLRATDNVAYSNKNKEIELSELSPPPPPPPAEPFIFKVDNDNDPMEILNYETPPPVQSDTRVYGHWSGANFAQDVLQHLKTQNKVNAAVGYRYESPYITSTSAPPQIDSFPYASEIFKKMVRLRTLKKSYSKGNIRKREALRNVEIIEPDWRKSILRDHAFTKPRHVQLTFRGGKLNKNQMDPNIYNSKESFEADVPDESHTGSLRQNSFLHQSHRTTPEKTPFDIRLENIMSSNNNDKPKLYDVRLENIMSSNENESPRHAVRYDKNKKSRSTYNKDKYDMTTDSHVELEGSKLAASKAYENHVSDDYWLILDSDSKQTSTDASNFDKTVKVGNALNEITVFKLNKENKMKSFVGGHDRVPGIETYRSDLDDEKQNVPSSLLPRVCKNLEHQDRVLFVQPDGSVDLYGINTSINGRNSAIEFILHNYKKCTLADSSWESNPYLLINWEKTPVQLFGGASAKKTIDMCGFF